MLVNTNVSKGYALPTALFNQPSGRYFRKTTFTWKGRYMIRFAANKLQGICIYGWILEETPRITDGRGIRKLTPPYGYDRLAYVLYPGRRYSALGEDILNRSI